MEVSNLMICSHTSLPITLPPRIHDSESESGNAFPLVPFVVFTTDVQLFNYPTDPRS